MRRIPSRRDAHDAMTRLRDTDWRQEHTAEILGTHNAGVQRIKELA